MTTPTVKARARRGTKSLEVTIPTKIVRDMGINEGDIFLITTNDRKNELIITYKRVYMQN